MSVILRSQAGRTPARLPVLAAGPKDSKEGYFGRGGQLNASSNTDAMRQFAQMMMDVAQGKVDVSAEANEGLEVATTPQERREHFITAYYDRTSAKWAELGASIGATLYDTAVRDGFMRRLLARAELMNGNIPRILVRAPNVTALVASGPGANSPLHVRERFLYPPEFYVSVNVRVEEREIVQGGTDLLEDVFVRSQEAIMVTEDRAYIRLLNSSVGVVNDLQIMAGGVTPSNLAAMRAQVTRWGLPATRMLIASDIWTDIVGNAAAFANLFDPVTQYEIVRTGYIGTLLGIEIITDGYRDPMQKVLSANELYLLSDPLNHGAYTDRGPVQANPVDDYAMGTPARGWFLFELLSLIISNPRSVAKAVRS